MRIQFINQQTSIMLQLLFYNLLNHILSRDTLSAFSFCTTHVASCKNNFHGNKLLDNSVRLESLSNCYQLTTIISPTAGLIMWEGEPRSFKHLRQKRSEKKNTKWAWDYSLPWLCKENERKGFISYNYFMKKDKSTLNRNTAIFVIEDVFFILYEYPFYFFTLLTQPNNL